MADKFDRMPKGDHQNENLKSYTPGSDMFGKGYLKDYNMDACEDGYDNGSFERTMESTTGKKPSIYGEDNG